MTGEIPSLVDRWLAEEYEYARGKYGHSQSEKLKTHGITSQESFGGHASSYWDRLQTFGEEAPLQAAQAAAKSANACRMLWATIRAFEWEDNRFAVDHSRKLVVEHIEEAGYSNAKRWIGQRDYFDTPMGLGLAYLGKDMSEHGLARKFRLGYLMAAQEIMEDASEVMAFSFDFTLSTTGELPRPGQSSGNVETWDI